MPSALLGFSNQVTPGIIYANNTPEGPAFRDRLELEGSDVGPQSAAGSVETKLKK